MTVQTFLPLLAAFFWGCLLTEIRWIGKMRRLRADAEAQGDPPREDTLQSPTEPPATTERRSPGKPGPRERNDI